MATNQPGALDAATDLFVYTNRAATTLNGGITAVATTIVVADGSVFPASGRFKVTIENEIIDIASISSNTLTVETRGAESTTGAIHATATAIACQITAGTLEAVRDAVIATQEGHVRYPDAHSGTAAGISRYGHDEFENVRRFCL